MSVEDLGKKLLAEVEEVGLDEILNSLRVDHATNVPYFGHSTLDHMASASIEARVAAGKTQAKMPIIELMSMLPSGGKTSLLYHLTATAVLPTNLGGRQAAAVIIDTDGRFSIHRLVLQLRTAAQVSKNTENGRHGLDDAILAALKHVHIFHPQSLASTVATARSLETYLFDAKRHNSFDRSIAFIALDSASSFYWQNKSDIEDAALLANTKPPSNGYVQLAAALKNASKGFNTPVIFTSWHLGPPVKNTTGFALEGHSIRPSLPPPWQDLPTLRLIVQRSPVRKLPVEISIEEAKLESGQRQKVVEQGRFECFVNEWGVEEGRFECFVNEWGVEERILQTMRSGFEFSVTRDGVGIEGATE